MGFYPFNTNRARRAQTDVHGVTTLMGAGVMYTPGSPALDDVDWYVASVDMKVGAYTLAHTAPDVGARNVTVTQTAVDAEDTNGTIVVVGKDLAGNTITETLTPDAGKTVAGTKAFAEITSITGVGWVTGGGAATVKIYTGTKPADPGTAITSQVLLGTCTCSATAGAFSGRRFTFNAITQDSAADTSGTATWARFLDGAGTGVLDVDVTTSGGGGGGLGVPVYVQQTQPAAPAIWCQTDAEGAVIDILRVT